MNSVIHKDDICLVLKTDPINYYGLPANPVKQLHHTHIGFQNGHPGREGQNGLTLEAVIAIALNRLENVNQGNFKCEHNDIAIEHLKAAKLALELRVQDRNNRGVTGTSER